MIKCGFTSRSATIGAKIQSFLRFKWFFSLAIAALVTFAATPPPNQEAPDELYIRIMAMIDRADALRTSGQTEAARAKYVDAEKALLYFKAANPLFAPKTVAYRLKEVTERADARPAVVEPVATPKTSLEAPAPSAKSGVKLIDAGAEPRTVLRFHPQAGDKQTMLMTVKSVTDVGGGAPVQKAPTQTLQTDVAIKSLAPNGDITHEIVIGDVTLAPADTNAAQQVSEEVKAIVNGMKGTAVTVVMSARGINKSVEVKLPATATPQMQQAVESMKEGFGMDSALPEEAVGVGAKWELRKSPKISGLSSQVKETYQLVSMDGNNANISFTSEQIASNQLTRVSVNTTGTNLVDLTKVSPLKASMNTHQEVSSSATKPPIDRKSDLSMEIQSN